MDIRSKSYYKYLSAETKRLLNILYPEVPKAPEAGKKALERKQFIESYQPQKSFTGKVSEDIKTLLTSFYKAPSAFRQMGREAEEEARAEQARIIAQGEPKTAFGKLTSPYERYKYGAFGERAGEVDPMLQSKIFGTKISNMLIESYKKTGKWFYKPKERLQEYKEHPVLEPFEDIVNVSILLAPLLKGFGVGAKLAKTAPVKAVSKMKVPKAISAKATSLKRGIKFRDITSEMQFKQYQRLKWLQEGKLKATLEAVPTKSGQLELEALLTRHATPWRLTPEIKTAYKYAERSATIETKALINKGLLTAKRHKFGVWKDLTKEFGKSIEELKALGIKEPVYYPHTFADHYAKTYLRLRKTTPAYLKTKKGVLGYEEPFISIPKHKAEYITQKTITEGLDNIAKTFGKKIGKEGLLPGYAKFKPKGYFEYFKKPGEQLIYVKKAGAYKNLQIPRQIDIACSEAFRNPLPVTMEKFFKATWDPLTNAWKMSVLALSPRWIYNNIVGNLLLNTAGAVSPEGYVRSIRAIARAKKAVKTKGITFERAMMREHVPARAWQGLYRAEARAATPTATGSWLAADKAPVTSMWKKLGYKVGAVPRAMYKFNSGVESFFRTAHYLDKVGKPGFNSAKALASVNEFLFDYSRLSTLEKATIRRLDPFWTWHKNIIRVTATYPIKYPQRVALLKKVQELTQDEQRDYRFLPEYLKSYEELPFGIGGEQAFLSTRGMNPFADVMAGISALHPALKIPIERATGVELWRERPFTSPYQQYYGAGEKVVPPIWRHIISQFPHAKLIETMFRPYAIYSTGEPILDKEGQIKYQKSRLLEVLKMFGINITTYDLDQMYEQGVTGAMREQTAKETYQEKLEKYRAR